MAVSAKQMVDAIKAALLAAPAGVVEVVVDGQTVRYDRGQAIEELRFWQREQAKEGGRRPRAANINLGGF